MVLFWLSDNSHVAEIGKTWQLWKTGDAPPRMGPKDAHRSAGEQSLIEVGTSRYSPARGGMLPQATIGTFGAIVAAYKVLLVRNREIAVAPSAKSRPILGVAEQLTL